MEYNTYHRYYKVTIELRPSEIKFTQDSVAMCFKDGHDLNETCKDIAVGNLQVNQLPKIRVILQNGIYYSSDNRRLYIFRVLERLGFLKKIYVFEVKQTNRDITTENGGCHIKIRNRPDTSGDWTEWKFATIYRHCPCPYAWKGREIPDWWDSNRKCHRNIKGIVPNPYLAIDDVTKVPQNNKIRKFKPQTTKEEKISKSSTNNASMKKVRETNLSRGEPTQETNATNCSYIFVNTNKCNMNIDTNTTLKICQNNSMEAENEEFPKNSYKYYFIAVGAAVAIGSLYYHTTYKLRPSSKPMVPSSNASSLLSKKVSKTRSWLTSWWSGTKSPTEYASGFSSVVSSSVNHLSEKLKSERNIAQTVSGTMENLTNLASSWSGTKSPTEYASGFSSVVSSSVNRLSEMFKGK